MQSGSSGWADDGNWGVRVSKVFGILILGNEGLPLVSGGVRSLFHWSKRSTLVGAGDQAAAIAVGAGNDGLVNRCQGITVVAVAVCTSGVDSHVGN